MAELFDLSGKVALITGSVQGRAERADLRAGRRVRASRDHGDAILPGWIKTGMTADLMANEEFATAAGGRIPMRRWGKPEDFAGLAVYLMGEASGPHRTASAG